MKIAMLLSLLVTSAAWGSNLDEIAAELHESNRREARAEDRANRQQNVENLRIIAGVAEKPATETNVNVTIESPAATRVILWESQEAYDNAHRGAGVQLVSECDAHPERCESQK